MPDCEGIGIMSLRWVGAVPVAWSWPERFMGVSRLAHASGAGSPTPKSHDIDGSGDD